MKIIVVNNITQKIKQYVGHGTAHGPFRNHKDIKHFLSTMTGKFQDYELIDMTEAEGSSTLWLIFPIEKA